MDLRNCRMCGRMFQYVGQPVCPGCMKAMEDKLQEVKEYLREHERATVGQVSEELDISVKQIRKWVQEERLMFAPGVDTGLVCSKCGMPVESGSMCKKCKESLKKTLQGVYCPTPTSQEGEPIQRKNAKMHYKRYE